MAITKLKTGLFNTNSYDNPDRRYSSLDFVKSNSFAHNGFVSGNRSEFSITNPSGLVININEGLYNIGGHYIDNDTVKTFQLQPTSAGFERYDIIVVGVTRDGARTIDGASLSREGYVRVIQGTQAAVDTAQPSFNEIVSEDFLESSGTQEVELAIIKVVSGAVTEIVDRRLSTTTEEIRTVSTKFILTDSESNEFLDFTEFDLITDSVLNENMVVSGGILELLNKVFETRISNLQLDSDIKYILIKINGVETKLYWPDFWVGFQNGNNFFKFTIKLEDGEVRIKNVFNPDMGLGIKAEGIDEDGSLTGLKLSINFPLIYKKTSDLEFSYEKEEENIFNNSISLDNIYIDYQIGNILFEDGEFHVILHGSEEEDGYLTTRRHFSIISFDKKLNKTNERRYDKPSESIRADVGAIIVDKDSILYSVSFLATKGYEFIYRNYNFSSGVEDVVYTLLMNDSIIASNEGRIFYFKNNNKLFIICYPNAKGKNYKWLTFNYESGVYSNFSESDNLVNDNINPNFTAYPEAMTFNNELFLKYPIKTGPDIETESEFKLIEFDSDINSIENSKTITYENNIPHEPLTQGYFFSYKEITGE